MDEASITINGQPLGAERTDMNRDEIIGLLSTTSGYDHRHPSDAKEILTVLENAGLMVVEAGEEMVAPPQDYMACAYQMLTHGLAPIVKLDRSDDILEKTWQLAERMAAFDAPRSIRAADPNKKGA